LNAPTAASAREPGTRPPSTVRQLLTRATWNLTDQAVSSASNFALSILIARSVDRYQFGAFAVSFALFSFLIGVVRAIGRYPLIIRFGDAPPAEFRRAVRAATGTVCAFGLLAGLLAALVGLLEGGHTGAALVAMGIVLPLVLLQDTWRGVLIGAGRPAAATLNDAVWTVTQFAAVGWLLAIGINSTPVLIITWGTAGGLAALFGIFQTRAVPRLWDSRRWVVDHWDQAGFFLAEWVLVLGAMQVSLLLIAVLGDVEDVGAIRGALVLLGPLNLVASSAFEFVVPELVRRPRLSARERLRTSNLLSGVLAFITLGWGGALLAIPPGIGRQLMGDTWQTTRLVLPAAVLWTCGILISTGPAAVLRALGRARVSFRINALASPMLMAFSLIGVRLDGAEGAAAGFALAHWLVLPLWWHSVRTAVAEAAKNSTDATERPATRTERPLRLVVVVGTLHENGGLRVVLELARRWNQSGTPAELFVLQPARTLAATVDDSVPVRYGCKRHTRLRYAWPLVLLRLALAARRADFVVSSSETGTSLLFGFLGARLAHRRFAVIVHASLRAALRDWMPRRQHGVARRIHRHSDATICVSSRLVPELEANGVSPRTTRVIPNGIDSDRVRALARARAPEANGDRATVAAAGRLSPEKGFDLLLRAHAQVRQAGVAHRLLILGDGPERPRLLALVRALGVDDSVELAGFRANPFPDLAAADLFCLPSRYEGFPLALLEALALGLPIVSTDCGKELLADGRYGQVVTSESATELAAAIEGHLRDPERLRAIARRGPDRAREFGWPQITSQYQRFLVEMREAAGNGDGPASRHGPG
jgi:glycosyltransferase involved in cell wall biosynthesis/O-antigen/teichoic acid export membrane protein